MGLVHNLPQMPTSIKWVFITVRESDKSSYPKFLECNNICDECVVQHDLSLGGSIFFVKPRNWNLPLAGSTESHIQYLCINWKYDCSSRHLLYKLHIVRYLRCRNRHSLLNSMLLVKWYGNFFSEVTFTLPSECHIELVWWKIKTVMRLRNQNDIFSDTNIAETW